METPQRTQPEKLDGARSGSLREHFAQAARFWEPRRLVYNIVLAAFVLIWIVASWPHFRSALTFGNLLRLAGLALLANVCYSAAYLVDIPLQGAGSSGAWKHWRWGLWVLGTLLAVAFENYWIADEIYPFVN